MTGRRNPGSSWFRRAAQNAGTGTPAVEGVGDVLAMAERHGPTGIR
jgi:hypothetical protein